MLAVIVGDLVAAGVATALAGSTVVYSKDSALRRIAEIAGIALLFVVMTGGNRAYDMRHLGIGSDEYKRVFEGALRFGALLGVGAFAMSPARARDLTLITFPATLLLALLFRACVRRALSALRSAGSCLRTMVVLGPVEAARRLIDLTVSHPSAGFRVVAVCADDAADELVGGLPVFTGHDAVLAAVHASGADTVAITATSGHSPDDIRRLSWQLEGSGIDFLVEPRIVDVAGPRITVRPIAGLPLLHVDEPEFQGIRRLTKTAFDKAFSFFLCLLILPAALLIAIAIRLDSSGPVFFRQRRVGANGTTFVMWKFRTMYTDAEQVRAELLDRNEACGGVLFKIRQDPRVTRVGRFLRRVSLDELPQLLNVLRGEMSLVGPRPPLPAEVASYAIDVRRRLLVKPGLTGLWQVSGRSDLSWSESVRLDLFYVENWSLALDLSILARTLGAVMKRRGAY